jgi:prolyl-tRNA editing enzyme YbaK/EbsC (Cys-tRNA(Pro) deacylase)
LVILDATSVSATPVTDAEKTAEYSVGAVHPFGNLIGPRTYFARKLVDNDYVFFSPRSHTKSIKIGTSDLVELHRPNIIEFTKPL